MKIILEKTKYHRFAWYFDYSPQRIEFARTIKESFGWQNFTFEKDGDKKRWVFSNKTILEAITAMFPQTELDTGVQRIILEESAVERERQQKSHIIRDIKDRKETDFIVKGIKGEPYQYQKVGMEFIDASGGKTIVADAPGVGKSLQALGYAVYKKFDRTLIVCPASVKFAWESEVKKWTKMSSVVIDNSIKLNEIPSDINFWIINYDILKKHLQELTKIRFDYLIGDEAHMIKNPTAQRTKAFRQIASKIPHTVLMTGTPILSRPVELFSLLNIVDANTWSNYYDYVRRYCDAKRNRFGLDVSGSSNEGELHNKIKGYFIRRKKEDVLSELPTKNHISLPVELSSEYIGEYNKAEESFAKYLIENQGYSKAHAGATIRAEKLAKLNFLRNISAKGKVKTAKDIIDNIIDSGEKVLVFSSFVEPLELMKEEYGDKAVMITGKTDVNERGKIVKSFQEDDNVKVFLGGFKSAGVGITLTAAENVLFLDYSWTIADHQQAEDRAHRPGATAESLNIYQLHAKNTIDTKLKEILDEKRSIISRVIEGDVMEDNDNSVKEVVDDIMARRQNETYKFGE